MSPIRPIAFLPVSKFYLLFARIVTITPCAAAVVMDAPNTDVDMETDKGIYSEDEMAVPITNVLEMAVKMEEYRSMKEELMHAATNLEPPLRQVDKNLYLGKQVELAKRHNQMPREVNLPSSSTLRS